MSQPSVLAGGLLGVLLAASGASPTAATDRYVDAVAGSDASGDGSASAPWKSITYALQRIPQVGTDLWIAPGVYDAANGETFPIGGMVFRDLTLHLHGSTLGPSIVRPGDGLSGIAVAGFERNGALQIEDLVVECAGVRCGTGIASGDHSFVVKRSHIEGFDTGIDFGFDQLGWTGPGDYAYADLDANELRANRVGIRVHAGVVDWDVWPLAGGDFTNNLLVDNDVAIRLETTCLANLALVSNLPRIWNNTIVGSTQSGIELKAVSIGRICAFTTPEIGNNVIALSGSYGIDDGTGAETDPSWIAANDFWMNAQGDVSRWVNGAGNLFQDPAFVDVANGDYSLRIGSPCIDTGIQAAGAPGQDHDGIQRPLDGDGDGLPLIDIGAYELAGSAASSVDLRRADFSRLDPVTPDLASAFPFGAGNPRTPVAIPSFQAGDVDAGALGAANVPLALYQIDPQVARDVMVVKEHWPTPSGPLELRFHVR